MTEVLADVADGTANHAPIEVDGDEPTALYRFYDADGVLLYVGISVNLAQRWEDHAADKFWWPRVARKTVVLYGSRKEALAAEALAIVRESPVHNVVGQVPLRAKELVLKRLERRVEDAKRALLETDTFRLSPEVLSWLDDYGKSRYCDRHKALGDLLYRGTLQYLDEDRARLNEAELAMTRERAFLRECTAAYALEAAATGVDAVPVAAGA